MQSLPPIVICFTFKLRDESFDLELVTRCKFLEEKIDQLLKFSSNLGSS